MPKNPITRRSAIQAGGALAAGLVFAGVSAGAAQAATATPANGRRRGDAPWPAKLSPTQQVGQRVIYSYPGLTPPDSLLQLIRAGEVGGLIFFGENISSLTQIAAVVQQLKQAHAEGPISEPLLLMTDQEGGLIRRLAGAEPVLSEKAIGESAHPLIEAAKAGTGAGQALRGIGMNLNLSPVLDVFRTPGDFDDQFERSYSSDPRVAGALGAAFVVQQQRAGVLATAKHFPGLGAATADQNTDLTSVTLDQPLSEILRIDEAAFVPSILAGVDLVMTSWAVYPALDRVYPAGVSSKIVKGELRGRLRFGGVTITDALEAGSLDPFGATGQRGVLSAKAGMDLLLCSVRDVAQGQETVAAVTEALQSRQLDRGQFQASLRRVQALRNKVS